MQLFQPCEPCKSCFFTQISQLQSLCITKSKIKTAVIRILLQRVMKTTTRGTCCTAPLWLPWLIAINIFLKSKLLGWPPGELYQIKVIFKGSKNTWLLQSHARKLGFGFIYNIRASYFHKDYTFKRKTTVLPPNSLFIYFHYI